uniref:autotransporter outer membrane beta-barrel domain-containing protein n=1 Tax=Maricaulis sp. TaxID=1486257 RepID=UPI0025C393E9
AGSANSGNDSSLTFGLGGFGGAGNRADTVDVEHHGDVFVEGEQSVGVLVQSVGGGGGAGGLNVSGNMALGSSNGYAVAIGIGGFAGGGDDAGNVSLVSTGNVVARNQAEPGAGVPDAPELTRDLGNTTGILVQSIGGGGGQGGVNITGVASRGGNPIAAGVGGFGGSGGNAGTVSVTRGYNVPRTGGSGPSGENTGVIQTFGDDSFGLIAQSIGGGGGDAGMNFSFIGSRNDGSGAKAANITIGGDGAGAGFGNTVTVDHFGVILTTGQDSVGLLAQSVGGGGGNANYNLGLGYLSDEQKAFSFDMGGGAGAAGTGGAVFVNHNGTIVTEGEDSVGLLAQSLGGGGGNAAFDLVEALEDIGFEEYLGGGGGDSLDISIGRRGGAGGSSDRVDVFADGLIQTSGQRSTAVLAQSIGGGGGNSGTTSVGASVGGEVNVAVGLEGGTGAFSGDVAVSSAASIYTEGQSAHGIHAQSIGGGGGAGGSAGNFRAQAEQSLAIAVGGSGGSGNISGRVTVRSDGLISTLGTDSDGILAQSIGGGGGTGGNARTFSNQSGGDADNGSVTMTVNVGGSGTNGSAGNTVDVINTGYIFTAEADSNGIRAQSIGGGGGNGGLAINGSRQGSGDSTDATFNLGGNGAVGGPGRAVTVTNEGLISTGGANSTGITAQSIGGGGGNAGLVIDAVFGGSGGAAARRTVMNIGGTGGAGGSSGDVTVFNRTTAASDSGQIYTTGSKAYGIFAQSLSGGGGNGSSILAFTALAGAPGSSVLGLNIGGQGGVSGTAGNVRVVNDGFIQTTGTEAHGIFAQSAAGGGGNGGLVLSAAGIVGAGPGGASIIAVGGQGGDGGNAGNVTVENTGSIVTYGARAHGILAQSVGGGGGNAQLAIGGGTNGVTQAASGALNTLLGAVNSSSGGLGGTVVVNHTGNITVMGDGAQAIKAESINGGGGSVTFEIVDVLASIPGVSKVISLAESAFSFARLGATGVSDMASGSVLVETSGTLGAGGDNGAGAVGQSIGGGGGTSDLRLQLASEPSSQAGLGAAAPAAETPGIYAVLGGVGGVSNSGATLTTGHTGGILTNGANSMGLLMQSIGGGGGRSNIFVDAVAGSRLGEIGVVLGSTNGTIEAGGAVTRLQAGQVSTTGNNATGAILQSIGGGGGSSSVTLIGAGAAGSTMLASLGSDGGTTLDGGTVSARFSGGIFTQGAGSTGLLAQSIGGGGGEVRASGVGTLEATLGGLNNASGDGGDVLFINDGAISTAGDGSHGVLLQSIGGGGGVVLTDAQTSVVLNDGGVGDGGAIRFTQAGDIITGGQAAFGIIAQSLGGGGGWVDGGFAGSAGGAGRGGAIDFAIDGTVWAVGLDATGVFAQSIGRDGAGNILGQLSGLVRGGSGTGRGLWIDGGANNVFTSSGSISAVSNLAIEASTGSDAVINTGLVVGNIDLGSGINSFDNRAGSTFIAINSIDLRDPAPVIQTPLFAVSAEPVMADPVSAEPVVSKSGTMVMDGLDPSHLGQVSDAVGAVGAPALVNLDQAMAALDTIAAPASQTMISLDQAMSSLNRLMTAPAPASNKIAVMDLSPVTDPASLDGGLAMVGGEAQAPRPEVVTIARGDAPVVMDGLDPSAAATLVDGGAEAAQPEAITLPKGTAPAVMDVLDPGATAMSIDGGAPVQLMGAAGPAVSAPALNAASFSNSGDFQMGLSASRLPIDLLNGAEFENFDAMGDPQTNLLYGVRVINTVALDGHFEQTAAGHLAFDVAFGPYASDHVDVTGTATVAGTGDVILTWLETDAPVTLFATAGGGFDNGLAITDTLAVDFSIEADAAGVHLLIDTDFGLPSLNRNGRALGGHMDSAIQAGGSAGIGRLMAFLGNMQESEVELYEAVFAELNPEPHLAALQGQLASANTMSGDLFNCGSAVSSRDDQCVWSRLVQSSRDRTSSFENLGVDSGSTRFSGGFQQPLGHDWSVAVAIGYEQINETMIDGGRAKSDGQGFTAGLGLERQNADGHYYGASVSGGWSWLETARSVSVFEPGLGLSEPQTGHVRLDAHVGNVFRTGSVFANPSLGLGLTALRHSGLTETGLDGLGVQVIRDTQLIASLNPVVRLGHVFHESDTAQGAVSLTVGARVSSSDRVELPIRFTGANPTAAPAMIGTVLDEVVYQLGADISIVDGDRVNVSFSYGGEFGANTELHRTGLDFRVRF